MSPGDHVFMVRKRVHGVCHRCGWSGYVTKFRRRDRKLVGIGRTYGRLCQQCFDELLANQSAPEGTKAGGGRRLKTIRDSDVA